MSASLSTHVLDTAAGRPAAGVTVELAAPDGSMAGAETDGDGRAPARRRARRRARTELVFHPPSPFFRRVELQIELEDGHYHVPLLVSPYGCASYRGS